jgi:hypothetical protein
MLTILGYDPIKEKTNQKSQKSEKVVEELFDHYIKK